MTEPPKTTVSLSISGGGELAILEILKMANYPRKIEKNYKAP